MQCLKCSTKNPDSARFCLECGTALPESIKTGFSPSDTSKNCPKCNISNPKDARYCLECGNPLEDVSQPLPSQCPTCGISIDTSRLFCPNCGQSLIKKPLDAKKEQIVAPRIDIECPACGQLTTGDYCRSCGYNLRTHQRKRPIDWWYCDRDSAIMTEIDPNSQILLSRSSLDESLAQAIDNNILQSEYREKARSLALQLFENGVTTNFIVLSNVRCPICNHHSIAPITQRPQEKIQTYPTRISLTISSFLRNGIIHFQTYPQLLIIVLCSIITNLGLILLRVYDGISFFSYEANILISLSSPFLTLSLSLISITSGGLLFSIIPFLLVILLTNNFFQCWYIINLKEIRYNKEKDCNIGENFKKSFMFFPRAAVAQLIYLGIMVAIIIGAYIVIFLSSAALSSTSLYEGGIQVILIFIVLLLFVIIGILGTIFLFTIQFSYVNMSIIFDEKSGVILNLKRSWRFGRKYFGETLGLYGLVYGPIYFLIAFGFISGPFIVIFSIIIPFIEAFKSLSLGWAYDEYKKTID